MIRGGTPGQDSVLGLLMPEEYVVRADGSNLGDAIQHFGGVRRYANGGLVVNASTPPVSGIQSAVDSVFNSMVAGLDFSSAAASAASSAFGNGGSGGNAANKAIVQALASNVFGWASQLGALNYVEMRESGYNNTAQNPTSTAYGMFQFLDSTWGSYGPKTSNPYLQAMYGLEYIKGRYGDPSGAAAHEQQFNWYDTGGIWPSGTSGGNASGHDERVLSGSQTDWFEAGRAAAGGGGNTDLLEEIKGLRADIQALPNQYQLNARQGFGNGGIR